MSTTARDYGIHFAIGLQPSPTLTPHDRELLESLHPAGVILFKPNFAHGEPYESWLETLRQLLDDVRGCTGRDKLMVAIDHEGGRVIRTPPPLTHYAYAREWADRAADVAHAMGAELRALGMNVTFGPVVDIHSNPDNPVIGPRSFATTSAEVTRAALEFIRAVEAEDVASCPKHFPGHGDTAVDSHHGLPVVNFDLAALRARELLPFKACINAGVRMIMTSHILFPKIDAQFPATMSRTIIHDVLRAELGFDGVVVTDDIGMGAVRDMFDEPETVERIMNAGSDIIDICAYGTDTKRALKIAKFIADGVERGRIDRTLVEKSAQRITALLDTLPQHRVQQLDASSFEQHARLAPLHHAETKGVGTWEKPQTR